MGASQRRLAGDRLGDRQQHARKQAGKKRRQQRNQWHPCGDLTSAAKNSQEIYLRRCGQGDSESGNAHQEKIDITILAALGKRHDRQRDQRQQCREGKSD
ncbi:MAG: hypothetical protein MZV70_49475 [Desulfobacterales bacterium]|nr:hypothetical protein [Desulfobacterales bacterium]